jgi:hypothetical protein
MLSLPTVIAPVNFSECSRGAARYAGRLAYHFQPECAEESSSASSELSPVPLREEFRGFRNILYFCPQSAKALE